MIPGIHPNTLAAFLLATAPVLLQWFVPLSVGVFMVAMGMSHTFLSFLPSVFLGMPEGETALSLLPGHQLLLEGHGQDAILLTVVGGVGVMAVALVALPGLFILLPFLYTHLQPHLGLVLIGVVIIMVGTEQRIGKAFAVFLLAGVLGYLSWSPAFSSPFILFPLFTGLFGVSTLMVSLRGTTQIPPQHPPQPLSRTGPGVLKGLFSGMIVGILPGIGASQAGILVQHLSRRHDTREFLVALGGINTIAAFFSLLALFLIHRPRSGIAVAVERLLGMLGTHDLLVLIAASTVSVGISALLTVRLSSGMLRILHRIPYRTLLTGVILYLVGMTMLLTGGVGLLLLGTATGIGLLAPLWGVRRTQGMGVLLLPLIFFYI